MRRKRVPPTMVSGTQILTDAILRDLKPKNKPYKVTDRDGLYVYVLKSGTISFRYNYAITGRQETLVLGRNGPDGIKLSKARELLVEAKKTRNALPRVAAQRAGSDDGPMRGKRRCRGWSPYLGGTAAAPCMIGAYLRTRVRKRTLVDLQSVCPGNPVSRFLFANGRSGIMLIFFNVSINCVIVIRTALSIDKNSSIRQEP